MKVIITMAIVFLGFSASISAQTGLSSTSKTKVLSNVEKTNATPIEVSVLSEVPVSINNSETLNTKKVKEASKNKGTGSRNTAPKLLPVVRKRKH